MPNRLKDLQILDDFSKINNADNLKFIEIINLFCGSLVKFSSCVKEPIESTYTKIKKKYIRGKFFDDFVIDIELFNEIIGDNSEIIKQIILSLNKLFVEKNFSDLAVFISNLRIFLAYNINNNVFVTLNKLKLSINSRYQKDNILIKNISHVNSLIFKIFDTTITITTLFIPGLDFIKSISYTIGQNIDNPVSNAEDVNRKNSEMSKIIDKLMSIDIQDQMANSINIDDMFKFITTNRSDDMIKVIEELQVEYINLQHITQFLKNEIMIYKFKKKNLISRILIAIGQ
jgi:hypothetical protein